MTTVLQDAAARLTKKGYTINSVTKEHLVAHKKKSMNPIVALIGIAGLFFFLIPGLLILLLGYVARGEESIIVTYEDAVIEQALAEKQQAFQAETDLFEQKAKRKLRQQVRNAKPVGRALALLQLYPLATILIGLVLLWSMLLLFGSLFS